MNTIYAYWDAEQIKYILDAVAMMTTMQDYSDLMKVFGLVGLIVVAIMGLAKARGEMAVQYVMFSALWMGALFVPKQDVQIVDIAGGGGTYTVSNVPLGLAFFASAESHIGYWLTKTMETVFALPGTINFEKTGFMFASRGIVERQERMRFTDPNLVSSITNLTKDCIYPELNNNAALFDQVMKSGDIWADLGPNMNPGLYTTVYNPMPAKYQIVDCASAWSYVDFQMNQNIDNTMLARLGRMLNPTAPPSTVKSLVMSQMLDLNQFIFGVSKTAAETVKQAAMINVLADSTTFVPQMIGDTTSAQVAVASAQAAASANSSYRVMGKIAESSLPIIRNAIHMVILGLFPIVMLMIVVAGDKGAMVLKTYVFALLWINLWAPIYALLNFFTSWWMVQGARAAVDGMDPVSFASHQALMHSAISDQAVAGVLVLSVPVIAYMLTNVSAASFTSVISGIMSPASSAAQSAGGTAGIGNTSWGNVQMGNYSWNNRSANQWNTAGNITSGAPMMKQVGEDGSVISTFANGGQVLNRSQTVAQLGEITAGASSQVVSQAQTASKAAYQRAGYAEQARGHSLDTAFEQGKDFLKRQASGTNVGTSGEVNNVSGFTQAYSKMQQLAERYTGAVGLSDSQKMQFLSEVSAGIRGPFTAALKAQTSNDAAYQDELKHAKDYVDQSGFKTESNNVQQFSQRIQTGTSSEAGTQATQGIRASLREADTASRMVRQASSEAQAYELVASQTESGGSAAGIDLSNYIQERLGGASGANAALGGMSEAGKLQLAQRMAKEFAHDAAELIQTGDADINAGLTSGGPGVTPLGASGAAEAGVRSVGAGNLGRVPVGAKPSVKVDDGPGGATPQSVTPDQVKAAVAAGLDAGHRAVEAPSPVMQADAQQLADTVESRLNDPALASSALGTNKLTPFKDPRQTTREAIDK